MEASISTRSESTKTKTITHKLQSKKKKKKEKWRIHQLVNPKPLPFSLSLSFHSIFLSHSHTYMLWLFTSHTHTHTHTHSHTFTCLQSLTTLSTQTHKSSSYPLFCTHLFIRHRVWVHTLPWSRFLADHWDPSPLHQLFVVHASFKAPRPQKVGLGVFYTFCGC